MGLNDCLDVLVACHRCANEFPILPLPRDGQGQSAQFEGVVDSIAATDSSINGGMQSRSISHCVGERAAEAVFLTASTRIVAASTGKPSAHLGDRRHGPSAYPA